MLFEYQISIHHHCVKKQKYALLKLSLRLQSVVFVLPLYGSEVNTEFHVICHGSILNDLMT